MKRKLLKQIANEWKSNTWLAIELLIVSVVVYFLTLFLWKNTELMLQPLGMETDNCFMIDVSYVGHDSPSHENSDSTDETGVENVRILLDRLKSLPQVESAAVVTNGVPYERSFYGQGFTSVNHPDSLMTSHINMYKVTPDYVKVLRIRGTNGETSEDLASILADGKILVSENLSVVRLPEFRKIDQQSYEDWQRIIYRIPGDSLKNIVFTTGTPWTEDDGKRYVVAASIPNIKRTEFEEPGENFVVPINLNSPEMVQGSILVRVRPESRETFRNDILTHSNDLFRSGNRFFSNVTELSKIKQRNQAEEYDIMGYFLIIIVFLLICIFLGLLGTFWFRTQQRVSEIAVRKVNGATSGQIFRRLIGEGILLLAIVTPVAVLLDWLVAKTMFAENPEFIADKPITFIAAVVITFGLLAAMIALGIWFPATRAMKIDPALALKDE